MKDNKGFAPILVLLIIIGIVLVGGVSYYAWKNPSPTTKNISTNNQNQNANSFNWNSLSKSDLINIISKDKDLYFVTEDGLTLTNTIDLTGDGATEAIVSGNGGNSNVSFILMADQLGTISVAKQKEKDGTVLGVSLVEVGKVNYEGNFKLLPAEHGFYTAFLTATDVNKYGCDSADSVKAYVWNPVTKLFEWNDVLTAKYTAQVCK